MLTLRWDTGTIHYHDVHDLAELHTTVDAVAASSAIPLLLTITTGRADGPTMECVGGHLDRAALTYTDQQSRWYASEPELPPLLHPTLVRVEGGQRDLPPWRMRVRPETARQAIEDFFTQHARPQRLTWLPARHSEVASI